MKLNNLSAKKICRLISTGMVFSMPVSYTHLELILFFFCPYIIL